MKPGAGDPRRDNRIDERGHTVRSERTTLDRHLTPEEMERCAGIGAGAGRRERLGAHVRDCRACRGEVAALRTLHRGLTSLPTPAAPTGFADRVMARVVLPVPWHRLAWATLRRHWLVVSVALVAAVGTVGGASWWLFGRQGLTVEGLGTLVVEGLRTLAVRAMITIGRAFYDLGVVDLGNRLLNEVAPIQALAAMAMVSLLAFGALLTMKRLLETNAPRLQRARG